jgi:hypothetical protein
MNGDPNPSASARFTATYELETEAERKTEARGGGVQRWNRILRTIKPVPGTADRVSMERRTEERYSVQFEARVTAVGDQSHSAISRVADISNSGLSIGLPFQLAAGDMVEIEIADSTLYGNVIYSQPDSFLFRTGIEASRVVLGATGLSSILQKILVENLPHLQGLPAEAHFG